MKILNVEQGSYEWKQARLGIPTASQASRIMTPKKMLPSAQIEGYIDELLAEWISQVPADEKRSQFMDRGTGMEEEARDWFNIEFNTRYEKAGFMLTDDGRFGASPDGIWLDRKCAIEIKCASMKEHIHYMRDEQAFVDKYSSQVQASLWASEGAIEHWMMLSYHPTLDPVVYEAALDPEFAKHFPNALNTLWTAYEAYRNNEFAKYAPKPKPDPGDLPDDAATILEHPVFAGDDGLPF